ncbi:type VI secretion system protein TssA [Marinobacterium stanieri]|uniref:Type VI secretion system protein ImpA n=1 Tax=Marinobacterium stanieri TaxID=49186 RepID=A0A1N6X119_9GAMM|nr:type VI secretion system protein TssA [Marinobacterium stanieri]SIQ95971.1 type VI secretion system protein ImpA [Marinobacterium stanieri]
MESALLEPISDECIHGEDLREHPEWSVDFHALRDQRNAIRAQERKVLDLGDLYALAADWQPIKQQCLELLQTRTKDVEILAWLIEASVRIDGFAGLAESLELAETMLERFWGGLHPLPDDEGISATLFPLTGLNGDNGEGTLIMPVRMAPVLTTHEGEAVSTWDYIKSCELAQIQDETRRKRKIEDGTKTVEQWQQLILGRDRDSLRASAHAIDACRKRFSAIDQFLYERCGHDAPPTSAIKNILSLAWEALSSFAKVDESILQSSTESDSEPVTELQAEVEPPDTQTTPVLQQKTAAQFEPEHYVPASRDEALVMVSRLSLYFKESEPHSPLSYQMERVERWGRMELAELMEELLDDEAVRGQFFRLIGLSGSQS